MPHNPYQYGQGDAAYLNQIAHDIIATAHAGIDMTSLNRHQRRVEARHDRKRR
jgi:hypothetical protein